jgi:hypothetical protein
VGCGQRQRPWAMGVTDGGVADGAPQTPRAARRSCRALRRAAMRPPRVEETTKMEIEEAVAKSRSRV